MTGRKTTDKDERTFDRINDLAEARGRPKIWMESRIHVADRTSTLSKKVNNDWDECNGRERNSKGSSGTEKGNGRQWSEIYEISLKGISRWEGTEKVGTQAEGIDWHLRNQIQLNTDAGIAQGEENVRCLCE